MNVIHSAASALSVLDEKVKKNESRLNLYNDTPHFELSLDEFEVYALKRLKVRSVCQSMDGWMDGWMVHEAKRRVHSHSLLS
jgi:hypothetical protein